MKKTKNAKSRPMFARYLEGPKLRDVSGGYISNPGDTCILPPKYCNPPNSSTANGDYDY